MSREGKSVLEQKLKVGRYINLPNPVIAGVAHAVGAFVPQAPCPLTIEESTTSGSRLKGTRVRESNIVAGAGVKTHRNFQWLAWRPGAITHVPVGGLDVLTGPMSGCDLVLFNLGGVAQAGHLGTAVEAGVANAAVKNSWNVFANANPTDVIGGFNPFNDWVNPIPTPRAGKESSGIKIFGLMTTHAEYYTIMAFPQDTDINKLRIAGVSKFPSASLAALQNL